MGFHLCFKDFSRSLLKLPTLDIAWTDHPRCPGGSSDHCVLRAAWRWGHRKPAKHTHALCSSDSGPDDVTLASNTVYSNLLYLCRFRVWRSKTTLVSDAPAACWGVRPRRRPRRRTRPPGCCQGTGSRNAGEPHTAPPSTHTHRHTHKAGEPHTAPSPSHRWFFSSTPNMIHSHTCFLPILWC